MTNERITQLENQVQRWRRISLVLALLLTCAIGIGGTSVGMLLLRGDGGEFVWPWNRARHEQELARQRAVQAFLEVELLTQQQELAKAADEAPKKPGPP